MEVPWGAPLGPFLLSPTPSLGKVKTFLSEAMGGTLVGGLFWVSQVGDNVSHYCSPGNGAATVLCQPFSELQPWRSRVRCKDTSVHSLCLSLACQHCFLKEWCTELSLQGGGACCNQPHEGKYISLKLISLYGWILPSSWNFHKPVSSTLNLLIYFLKCKQLSNKILLHLDITLVMFCTFLLRF